MGDLPPKGRHEALLVHGLVPDMAVEIAIGAFRGAKGPVHVNTEARVPCGMIDHAPLMTVSARPVTIRPCRIGYSTFDAQGSKATSGKTRSRKTDIVDHRVQVP